MSADARCARFAGWMYLGTIACGVYAEMIARGTLIVRGDAAATAQAIFASQSVFRLGIIADIAMLAFYIVVTILFQRLFCDVSERLSSIAAAFSLIGIAVLACDTVVLAAILRLHDLVQSSSSGPDHVYLLIRIHGDGYKVSLVFFGVYCLLLSWLIWRGRSIPKAVGVMVAAAGACNLVNSLAWLGAPQWAANLPSYFTLPTLLGELALALWLLVFGARKVTA